MTAKNLCSFHPRPGTVLYSSPLFSPVPFLRSCLDPCCFCSLTPGSGTQRCHPKWLDLGGNISFSILYFPYSTTHNFIHCYPYFAPIWVPFHLLTFQSKPSMASTHISPSNFHARELGTALKQESQLLQAVSSTYSSTFPVCLPSEVEWS